MGQVVKMSFVRDEETKGMKQVSPVVKVARSVGEAMVDVARTYSRLLIGILELGIRIGLFVLLWPLIRQFLTTIYVVLQNQFN